MKNGNKKRRASTLLFACRNHFRTRYSYSAVVRAAFAVTNPVSAPIISE